MKLHFVYFVILDLKINYSQETVNLIVMLVDVIEKLAIPSKKTKYPPWNTSVSHCP